MVSLTKMMLQIMFIIFHKSMHALHTQLHQANLHHEYIWPLSKKMTMDLLHSVDVKAFRCLPWWVFCLAGLQGKVEVQTGRQGWRTCPVYHPTLQSDTEPSSSAEGRCSDSQWTESLDTWGKIVRKTYLQIYSESKDLQCH